MDMVADGRTVRDSGTERNVCMKIVLIENKLRCVSFAKKNMPASTELVYNYRKDNWRISLKHLNVMKNFVHI